MSDLQEVLTELRRVANRGQPSVLATIVKVAGSTYRRPGARMLFPVDAAPVGMLSGGCLENDLAQRAGLVLESGETSTVVYDLRSPDDVVWGLGLGCNGEVRVLLEQLVPGRIPPWVDFLERCTIRRETGVLVTVFRVEGTVGIGVGARVSFDASGCAEAAAHGPWLEAMGRDASLVAARRRSACRTHELPGGRFEYMIESVSPRPALVLLGAGRDARPLARLARGLGWLVVVADDRPAYANLASIPEADIMRLLRYDDLTASVPPVDADTAVVIMTHHFLHDLELLNHLLPTEAFYVGLLGPRQRRELLLRELASRGVRVPPDRLARLHGPAGLDIGSETPEEIALSILAEIRAVSGGRSGGFLRESGQPLHARDE